MQCINCGAELTRRKKYCESCAKVRDNEAKKNYRIRNRDKINENFRKLYKTQKRKDYIKNYQENYNLELKAKKKKLKQEAREKMANRVYTEFRITHESAEEKAEFEKLLNEQTKCLGLKDRIEYVRLVVGLDVATGIINKLKRL